MVKTKGFGSTVCILLFFQAACCQVKLPALISDGMVLQRDTELKIWGWAAPGENVTVQFNQKMYRSTTGTDGKWAVTFPSIKAGGPYTIDIEASNHITLKDILFGDVWICSGQSNMALSMERVKERYAAVIAQSDNPSIRHFFLQTRYDFNAPQQDIPSGRWESANPESLLRFSATGYFFAKSLFEKYQVPIGLINASVGGSPVEAWLSEQALQQFPEHLQTARTFKNNSYLENIRKEESAVSNAWYNRVKQEDKGFTSTKPWYAPDYDASSWSTMQLPGYWDEQDLKDLNGVVWFKKEIDIPADMTGKPAKLLLGRIVDRDSVYINGIFAGTTGYQYPPRRYDLPANLLKPGKNSIVVRVINSSGRGGFITDKPYQLTAGGQTIDLKGEWQYNVGAILDPLPATTFFQYKPGGLFNGMIAPLLKYPIKGVIWYQGESNTEKPSEYQELFAALIKDWRQHWGQGNFPFLYVQLANYMESKDQPAESNWAELREAQLKTLAVPNTGMAVTIDLGEWNDLHPLNKEDVGKRLARVAREVAYDDKKITSMGPIYQSMKVESNKIILYFSCIGSGLTIKDGTELKHFAIAGTDNKFVWAKAKIKGNKVIVWSDEVSNPVAVRYAWADNPTGANLYNKEGLPASPFKAEIH